MSDEQSEGFLDDREAHPPLQAILVSGGVGLHNEGDLVERSERIESPQEVLVNLHSVGVRRCTLDL